jgi:glycosyltransferase involved in cell wall biosynthesis
MNVLFVTDCCPPYRLQVFDKLSEQFNTHFVFTQESYRGKVEFEDLDYNLCLSKAALLLDLARTDYDILIANFPVWDSLFEFLFAKIRRKKVIFWVEEWHQPQTLIRTLVTPLLKYLARNCEAIVVSGSAAKVHMLNYGSDSAKIFTAPNASWLRNLPRSMSRLKKVSRAKFVVLYLGRLVKYKGADYLVKAFHKLKMERKAVKLVIVGDGSFKNELEQLVRDLEMPDVEFARACSEGDKSYYYDMCDLFVLPSIWQNDYCEAWGLVLNEAMQFGKPVITTNAVGSAFDLVKNGVNGYVVENSDIDALYNAMKKTVDDPKLAKSMGRQSKSIVEAAYTYEHMFKGFRDAIARAGRTIKK